MVYPMGTRSPDKTVSKTQEMNRGSQEGDKGVHQDLKTDPVGKEDPQLPSSKPKERGFDTQTLELHIQLLGLDSSLASEKEQLT